jgi:flagellar motor protein MotB
MTFRHLTTLIALPLLFAGCQSTEPFERQIDELTWKLDSAEQAAEQSAVDKRLAEREVELSQRNGAVLREKLALAYDALREARTAMDGNLHDRLTALSESTLGQERLAISQYGGVILESGILFGAGSHELTTTGRQSLVPLVATLMGSEYDDYVIELTGHTDSDPIRSSARRYRDNHDLGAMRANTVRAFLIEQGVPSERVYLSSWGPDRPIDADNKRANRRVEIVLHRQDEDSTTVPASAPRAE